LDDKLKRQELRKVLFPRENEELTNLIEARMMTPGTVGAL
jgi:hypothetical protein